jgi:uncharacterized protein YdhG (YjbR/CyaY superfamily)
VRRHLISEVKLMITHAATPHEWFKALPPNVAAELLPLRAAILSTIAGVRETLDYGMPTYSNARGVICALNMQRNYLAFYLLDHEVLLEYERELAGLDCGKTCVRFRKPGQFKVELAVRMLRRAVARQRAAAQITIEVTDPEPIPKASVPEVTVEPEAAPRPARKKRAKRVKKAATKRKATPTKTASKKATKKAKKKAAKKGVKKSAKKSAAPRTKLAKSKKVNAARGGSKKKISKRVKRVKKSKRARR